jgi:hypothetical protein
VRAHVWTVYTALLRKQPAKWKCAQCGRSVTSHIQPGPAGIEETGGPLILTRGNPPIPVVSDVPADCDESIVQQVMES